MSLKGSIGVNVGVKESWAREVVFFLLSDSLTKIVTEWMEVTS